MEAILKFNLPEDEEQFNTASKGMDWALVTWDIDQLLRKKLKYEEHTRDARKVLEDFRTKLLSDLTNQGLVNDFISGAADETLYGLLDSSKAPAGVAGLSQGDNQSNC